MNRIGIDLGGHTVTAARVELDCSGSPVIVQRARRETPASRGASDCIAAIAEMTAELAAGDSIESVGLAVPGMLSSDRRHARRLPNFPPEWDDLDVVSALERALAGCGTSAPVHAENDANCYALGEGYAGAAAGMSDYVVFTMGTGIGMGVVIGGRLLTGSHGMAGEGGHIWSGGDDVCGCGGVGHLETIASADGTERRASAAGLPADMKKLWPMRHDPAVSAVLEPMIEAMARAVSSVIMILDPEAIVIGGGMSEAPGLLDAIDSASRTYMARPFRGLAQILRSSLGADAAIYGAASL